MVQRLLFPLKRAHLSKEPLCFPATLLDLSPPALNHRQGSAESTTQTPLGWLGSGSSSEPRLSSLLRWALSPLASQDTVQHRRTLGGQVGRSHGHTSCFLWCDLHISRNQVILLFCFALSSHSARRLALKPREHCLPPSPTSTSAAHWN